MNIKSACLVTLLSIAMLNASAQTKKMFSQTPELILHYKAGAQKAWEDKDEKRAQTYYDSIRNCVLNSYIGDYHFITYGGEVVNTREIKKPMLITVSASWCAPCREELQALNKIADEYKDKVCFVVLFWDTKDGLGELAPKYSKNIILVPAVKKQPGEDGLHIVDIDGFKHVSGFPTSYGIVNKQIIALSEGATISGSFDGPKGKVVVTPEQASGYNYKRLKDEVESIVDSR